MDEQVDQRPASDSEPTERMFLVERYWPGIDARRAAAVVSSLEAAARQLTAEGTPVGHVGSFLMPADQVVFSLMTAADEAVVRAANDRAAAPLDRIATAIPVGLGPIMEGDR